MGSQKSMETYVRLNSESLIGLKLRSSQIFTLRTGDGADGR